MQHVIGSKSPSQNEKMQMNNIVKSQSPTPKQIKTEPLSPANQTAPSQSGSSPQSNSTTMAVKKEEVKEECIGEKTPTDKKYPFKKSTYMFIIVNVSYSMVFTLFLFYHIVLLEKTTLNESE